MTCAFALTDIIVATKVTAFITAKVAIKIWAILMIEIMKTKQENHFVNLRSLNFSFAFEIY